MRAFKEIFFSSSLKTKVNTNLILSYLLSFVSDEQATADEAKGSL